MWTPKVGDVVRLKSGGPLMTVESVKAPRALVKDIGCVWFDSGNLHRESFVFDQLVLDKPIKPLKR